MHGHRGEDDGRRASVRRIAPEGSDEEHEPDTRGRCIEPEREPAETEVGPQMGPELRPRWVEERILEAPRHVGQHVHPPQTLDRLFDHRLYLVGVGQVHRGGEKVAG